jgi:hypothetical protein
MISITSRTKDNSDIWMLAITLIEMLLNAGKNYGHIELAHYRNFALTLSRATNC